MFEITVLNQEETIRLLKMPEVVGVVEDVYKMKAKGESEVFPLVFHEFNPGVADMDIKSGWLRGSGIWGMKVVSWFGENPKKGLPALVGTVLVFDDKTGAPTGMLDGAHITGMRTGAAGALGAKYLARPNSETLLLVGAGHVATFQIAALLPLMAGIKRVLIYDGLSYAGAQKFAAGIAEKLRGSFGIETEGTVTFAATEDIAAATAESDIIITVTPSKTPIIKKDWVKPGTHFSCIGADMSGKEEIDPAIFAGARVFCDDIPQCVNVGEVEIPVATGVIKKEDIAGEIGEVVLGTTPGRQSAEQITIFDATGTALLDLLTANLALKAAKEQGLGSTVNL
ncbi:ornithine cyclodeaminase family protein [Ruminococcaceae bacterium OttesenSCG-928-D13]|nr:ornithine cyclodeaminase family protein [Ruminococcaceae bacterium OttesenSCG-928-D13]